MKKTFCVTVLYTIIMMHTIRAVLAAWSTVSGFALGWFSSLSSECLCVFSLHGAIYMYIYFFFKLIASSLPFSELSMEELALELVD